MERLMGRRDRMVHLRRGELLIGPRATGRQADCTAPVIGHDQMGRIGRADPQIVKVAVRAIVGQQISVSGATTVMGLIATRYGNALESGHTFPSPSVLMQADSADFPMPQSRARAIINLACAIAEGKIVLNQWIETETLKQQLLSLKGIGEWTASYIAMRALSDPDAFLHTDLVLLKVAKQLYGDETPKALRERSMTWRPWRAYAGMHLWQAAAQLKR